MFRYCALTMVVLISLSYGCSPPITQEITVRELEAMVRNPRIQFNDARFYHDEPKLAGLLSGIGIMVQVYAYRVVTDLKVVSGCAQCADRGRFFRVRVHTGSGCQLESCVVSFQTHSLRK